MKNTNPAHYTTLLKDSDYPKPHKMTDSEYILYKELMRASKYAYNLAKKRAKKIGVKIFK
jgi:hypothetical protein